MKHMSRTVTRAGAVTMGAAAILLVAAPGASAATETVCNAAFCNSTTGSGLSVSKVVATKIGQNRNVVGFFEVFGPRGLKSTGPTTAANSQTLRLSGSLKKNEFLCLRFFARNSAGGFIEIGTAQCTKAPF